MGVTEARAHFDEAQDALIAGTPFHARAMIACRQAMDPARAACDASVSVELRWTEGPLQRMRRLLFLDSRAVGSDAADAPR